jgi:formylglycine-generating enzyme required for sulfatase activity
MSRCEITNAQYCQYLNAALASGDIRIGDDSIVYGRYGSDPNDDYPYYNLEGLGNTYDGATNGGAARINWNGSTFTVIDGFENHPVTHVSWYGAMTFADCYGWSLPTEWEWQAVADYVGTFTYGCGTTINNGIANYLGSVHPQGTTPVGAFDTYGYDMADITGNVWEWTSSCYLSDCSDGNRVLRGGGWKSTFSSCSVAFRNGNAQQSSMGYDNGFRVCRRTSM